MSDLMQDQAAQALVEQLTLYLAARAHRLEGMCAENVAQLQVVTEGTDHSLAGNRVR